MFSTPLPRTSFLDSRLRTRGRQNRLIERGMTAHDSHLGVAAERPIAPLQARPEADAARQRETA